MTDSIFQDLRVVELASVLAGPAVGQFFVELGAQVIKVENAATQGDVTRHWKAPGEDAEARESAYFFSVNTGKEHHFLNLRDPADQAKVHTWVAEADVVISNYRAGSAEKLRMDYATLKALNPRLVYAELNGFGPGDRRPAFDVVLQAETGFLYLTGEPDQPPVKMPVALIDLLAAHQLKEGILVALLRRAETGKGSLVRTNLYAAALASLANQATNWLVAGFAPQRMGTAHPNIAPYGDLLRTADGKYIVPAVGSETQFEALCGVLQCPELIADERFASNAQRITHRPQLIAELQDRVQAWTQDKLMDALLAASVPAGAVRSIPEVFAQPQAERYLREATSSEEKAIRVVKQVVFELDAEE